MCFSKKFQLSLAVVAGNSFSWGWGKCPKVGHGPNILVSHTLNTAMTFSDLQWIKGVEEGGIVQSSYLLKYSF